MNILIVVATVDELQPFAKKYGFQLTDFSLSNSMLIGNHRIQIAVTRVGMTATAFALGNIFGDNKFDLAINVGIAGSFQKHLIPGTTVVIGEDRFSEFGAEDGDRFLTADEIGLNAPFNTLPNKKFLVPTISKFEVVKGITVNTVHGNEKSIEKVKAAFHPDVETMENAAFVFACNVVELPQLSIRTISNFVEKRDKSKWQISLAISELNKNIEELIQQLP